LILLFIALITATSFYGDRFAKHDHVNSIEYKILTPSTDIQLYNNESDKKLTYTPNTNNFYGIDLNLKNISIGASIRDPEADSIENKKSQYAHYLLKSVIKNALLEVYYLKYNGFKIGESEQNTLLDITARSYGVNYTFFIDSNVLVSQNLGNFEYDKTTNYGTFLTFGYTKNKLNSKDSLVPQGRDSDFQNFAGLKSFDQDALTAIYGLAGTWSLYKFYFQGSLGLGINYSQISYKGTDLKSTSNTGPAGRSYFNFGYQFKNSLLGIEAGLFTAADLQGDTELALKRTDTAFYYHYFF
jgi:hypothetical protein